MYCYYRQPWITGIIVLSLAHFTVSNYPTQLLKKEIDYFDNMDKKYGLKSTTTAIDSTETTNDVNPDPDSDPQSTEPTAAYKAGAAEDNQSTTAEENSPPITEDVVASTEPEPVPIDTPVITPPEESD